MARSILLLGSNLANREVKLAEAIRLIDKEAGKVTVRSSVYESEPWGFKASHKFLNQVVVIHTRYTPEDLLGIVQGIEAQLGRKQADQSKGYASRVIDIDILFYDNEIIETPHLTIPHKLLHKRRFALLPLNEIMPEKVHPVFNKSIARLLEECPDHSGVSRLSQC